MEPVFFIFGFIALAIIFRLIAGGFDGDRVERYIRGKGGKLLEKHWSPFGTGWFGEKNARIYDIRYADSEGNIHTATVKTSMLSGVYLTEDRIVEHAPSTSNPRHNAITSELLAENERLRRRIAELEDRQG